MAAQYQINTFTGGMDMDTDVNLVSNNTYRYAENIRIITDDSGTTGIIQNIEKIKEYDQLLDEGEVVIGSVLGTVWEENSLKECLILVTRLSSGGTATNKIHVITNLELQKPSIKTVLTGDIGVYNKLKIVHNYESPLVNNIYFTDGTSGLKVVNIAEDNTNIQNPQKFDMSSSSTVFAPKFKEFVGGNLIAGIVQYFVQLYKEGDSQTPFSGLSEKIYLYPGYTDYADFNGVEEGTATDKGCKLTVSFLNINKYTHIRMYRIQYVNNTDEAIIYKVVDSTINSEEESIQTIELEDGGGTEYDTLTIEELNKYNAGNDVIKTLEKKDNRLFVANIQESDWNLDYDARAYSCNSEGKVLLDSSVGGTKSYNIDDIVNGIVEINKTDDCVNSSAYDFVFNKNGCHFSQDRTTYGGTGKNIEYKIITVNGFTDPVKQQALHSSKITLQYLKNNNDVEQSDAYFNNPVKGTVSSQIGANYGNDGFARSFLGYQRDEVYRFGIVFYNNKSQASPVLWIADIRIPPGNVSNVSTMTHTQFSNECKVVPIGIEFTIKTIPNGAVACEIVRCERTYADRSVLAQVAISKAVPFTDWGNKNTEYWNGDKDVRPGTIPYFNQKLRMAPANKRSYNSFYPDTNLDNWSQYPSKDVYYLISPEICFNRDAFSIDSSMYIVPFGCLSLDTIYRYISSDSLLDINLAKYFTTFKNTDIASNYEASETNMFGLFKKATTGSYFIDNSSADKIPGGVLQFYKWIGSNKNYDKSFKIRNARYAINLEPNITEDIKELTKNYVNIEDYLFLNMCCGSVRKYGIHGITYLITSTDLSSNYDYDEVGDYPYLLMANIKRNVTQYGGKNYAARNNSIYVSTGINYNFSNGNKFAAFGGDCYINVLDYMHSGLWMKPDPLQEQSRKTYVQCLIPFESSINTYLRTDKHFLQTADTTFNTVDVGYRTDAGTLGTAVQSTPMYIYNTGYSEFGSVKVMISDTESAIKTVYFPNRVMVSEPKINNELSDSWRDFKEANYLDVDNQYGQITNLVTFNNKLYFFQDNAVGILSVNDRSLIYDNTQTELVLGTGGILTRYDYVCTKNGDKIINDKSIAVSNLGMYWFDYNKNTICSISNNGFQEISKTNNVQSFLNGKNIINEVCSVYDHKYNEVWFKIENSSLIFNERIGKFSSLYTHCPDFSVSLASVVVTIKNNKLYYLHNVTNETDIPHDNNYCKLQLVVNDNSTFTKVFDNVQISGKILRNNDAVEFVDSENELELMSENDEFLITEISESPLMQKSNFVTKHQVSETLNVSSIDEREDSYRFPIPREIRKDVDTQRSIDMSFAGRMRGKYLICNYSFDANDDDFKIDNIITTYRYSLV